MDSVLEVLSPDTLEVVEEIHYCLDIGEQGPPGIQGPQGNPGIQGSQGSPGAPGPGVPPGGTAGQTLQKVNAADYNTAWVTPAPGGVTSFNTRPGAVTLTTADVTGALGFSDFARTGVANTFAAGPQTVQSGAAGSKGLVVKGAASQTANLLECQNSAGTALTYVDSAGNLVVRADGAGTIVMSATILPGQPALWLGVAPANCDTTNYAFYGASGVTLFNGATNLGFRTGNAECLRLTNVAGVTRAIFAYLPGSSSGDAAACVTVIPPNATTWKGLVVRGNAGQATNLQEWQNSSGVALARITAPGEFSNPNPAGGSGSSCERFGLGALASLTTGNFDTAFGANALNACTTGSSNVAFGDGTLSHLTTGSGNVGIGHNALALTTSGGNNFGMGVSALLNNLIGSGNVGIGSSALQATTASNNTAIGQSSSLQTTTGGSNVSIGAYSLYSCTTGGSNVVVGYNAGGNVLASGSNNVLLGAATDTAVAATQFGVAIGYNASCASNECAFGPYLNIQTGYGFSSTSVAHPRSDITDSWPTSTEGSQKARRVFNIWDTVAREALRLESDGTQSCVAVSGAALANTKLTVYSGLAATKGLVVQGAPSQTANLQEWQSSTGAPLAYVGPDGTLNTLGPNFQAANASTVIVRVSSVNPSYEFRPGATGTSIGLNFYNTSGSVSGSITYDLGNGFFFASGTGFPLFFRPGGTTVLTLYTDTQSALVTAAGPAVKGLTVKGVASQTANLLECQNSTGTALTFVDQNGDVTVRNDQTAKCLISGTAVSGYTGIWFSVTPAAATSLNYAFMGNSSQTLFNSPTTVEFRTHNNPGMIVTYNVPQDVSRVVIGYQPTATSGVATANLSVIPANTAWTGLVVQGRAGQTANLQEWQSSTPAVLAKVDANGVLKAAGLAEGYTNKTAAYTFANSDGLVTADATTAAFALTLPAANSVPPGRMFRAKKIDASVNAATLTAAGADTIDGAATYALAVQYKHVTVESDGVSKWYVVSNN